jgi:hypothetical protein
LTLAFASPFWDAKTPLITVHALQQSSVGSFDANPSQKKSSLFAAELLDLCDRQLLRREFIAS